MSVQTILRHRATVSRSVTLSDNGTGIAEYETFPVIVDLPVLLDAANEGELDPSWSEAQRVFRDRAGILFAAISPELFVGDRVKLTRGTSGTFLIEGAPPAVIGAQGFPSHCQYRVRQVAP
jgi:hypothetical protein